MQSAQYSGRYRTPREARWAIKRATAARQVVKKTNEINRFPVADREHEKPLRVEERDAKESGKETLTALPQIA